MDEKGCILYADIASTETSSVSTEDHRNEWSDNLVVNQDDDTPSQSQHKDHLNRVAAVAVPSYMELEQGHENSNWLPQQAADISTYKNSVPFFSDPTETKLQLDSSILKFTIIGYIQIFLAIIINIPWLYFLSDSRSNIEYQP